MRDVNDPKSAFKIKEGVMYTVQTGYEIHGTTYNMLKSAYSYGATSPLEEGVGSPVEIEYWGVDVKLLTMGSTASALTAAAVNLLVLANMF